ncbi:MAG TPA: HAD family hydrolase [Neobacillus sp.]
MDIRAIFFDLDDTLHDSQKPFTDAFKEIFPDQFERPFVENVYKKFREFSDNLWDHYSKNELTLDELRMQRITLALNSFNCNISKQEAAQFQTKYESCLNHITLFPEVPKLLNTLKAEGITIGIISNGPTAHQWNKIVALGLTDYIQRELVFVSDEVGIAKPDPVIFHHAARKVNYQSNQLVYIGDSWNTDMVGSYQAGWKSIWFNHRNRQKGTEFEPFAEIKNLSSITDLVKITQK